MTFIRSASKLYADIYGISYTSEVRYQAFLVSHELISNSIPNWRANEKNWGRCLHNEAARFTLIFFTRLELGDSTCPS